METVSQYVLDKIRAAQDESSKSLDLSNCNLKSIPTKVFSLKDIEELNLFNNQIKEIPSLIYKLGNLRLLNVSNNCISKLPPEIGHLSRLNTLNLKNNNLTEISPNVCQLVNLRKLYLGNNNILTISKEIGSLYNLKYIDISKNKISELPIEIGQLACLENLDIDGLMLNSPPQEIIKRGTLSIINYFQELLTTEQDYIYEAKLLIVGEGGAGKTTLKNKIRDNNYSLDDQSPSTLGIDIDHHYFQFKDKTFRINIWDFGGQEIYHSTHQFFLTKRSLYILVEDTRREDSNFNYWLNIIELLSDNSPLLVVQNEKQDRVRNINERAIRERFDNFKSLIRTNLKTGRGLLSLLHEIEYNITNLPHIGNSLPKTWVRIRSVMEGDGRNHIGLDEYFEICKNNGIGDKQKALFLSEYLHDLGVCLHFQDNKLLKKLVILNSSWGTEAVYKIIDSPLVQSNHGHFSFNDLSEIWKEDSYLGMYDELLELMIKFELCYRYEATSSYIVPELLQINQPKYLWDEKQNLEMRFNYEFMPQGIMTRLIVRLHRYIINQDYVWKEGMLLDRDYSRAEIVKIYNKEEISIKVVGAHKKEFLTIINEEIEKIHESYPRIKVKKLIPCNCSHCLKTKERHFFEYEKLRNRLRNNKLEVECENSYVNVKILKLIEESFSNKENNNELNSEKIEYIDIDLLNDIDQLLNNEKTSQQVKSELVLIKSQVIEAKKAFLISFINFDEYLTVFSKANAALNDAKLKTYK